VVAAHVAHMQEQLAEIVADGVVAGDWKVKSAKTTAALILNATARFHHPAMVQLDGGKSQLAELDALMDVMIAGLKA